MPSDASEPRGGLTEAQRRILTGLALHNWLAISASEAGEVEALEGASLVDISDLEGEDGTGSMLWIPVWRITPAGRLALQEATHGTA